MTTRAPRFGWLDASLGALLAAAVASGMGQFAITAVIGDVASEFGQPGAGNDLQAQLGLTGSQIGLALAVIRLSSLVALPAASLADRFGRRPVLAATLFVGMAATLGSAAAPGWWAWVALVAFARPWLSTGNAVTQVVAAEAVSTRHRSWVMAAVAAAYAIGVGLVSIPRPLLPEGFAPVMLLAGVGIVTVPVVWRWVVEPPIARRAPHRTGVPGAVPPAHRRHVALLVVLAGGLALSTGPGYTYVILYGEQVVGMSRSTTSAIVLAAGPVGLVGLLAGRWAADTVGRRWAVASGIGVAAAGFVLTYQGRLGLLIAGYLLGLVGGAAMGPGLGAMAAEVAPTSIRATVAGWVAAAGVVGAAVGLWTFGALADAFGFGGAALALGGVTVVCAGAAFGMPETRDVELEAVDAHERGMARHDAAGQ